jgi:antitoxin (DNA-binding transcriptional repressor) of toxin-antitoxin stability system
MERAAAGEEVRVSRHGKPFVRLVRELEGGREVTRNGDPHSATKG